MQRKEIAKQIIFMRSLLILCIGAILLAITTFSFLTTEQNEITLFEYHDLVLDYKYYIVSLGEKWNISILYRANNSINLYMLKYAFIPKWTEEDPLKSDLPLAKVEYVLDGHLNFVNPIEDIYAIVLYNPHKGEPVIINKVIGTATWQTTIRKTLLPTFMVSYVWLISSGLIIIGLINYVLYQFEEYLPSPIKHISIDLQKVICFNFNLKKKRPNKNRS